MLPRSLVALAAAALVATAPPAAPAAVPRDGWGLGIADDSYLSPGTRIPDWFSALGAKTFRLQVHWNAGCTPGRIESARQWIAQARALGAEEVAVTFKEHPAVDCGDPVNCGAQPAQACYGERIAEVIRALAGDVDVWGPANEPNLGDAWLPGTAGARRLAEYWATFVVRVAALDPDARMLSPEFADRPDLGSIASYVDAYRQAGGGFGDYAGYHAYWGVHAKSSGPLDEFAALIPAGIPIWITEVGAFGLNPARGVVATEAEQADRVAWLLDDPRGLANHDRIARLSYYHLQASADLTTWDSALARADGTPRPSWSTWCAAAHGGDPSLCRVGADAIVMYRGWLDVPFFGG